MDKPQTERLRDYLWKERKTYVIGPSTAEYIDAALRALAHVHVTAASPEDELEEAADAFLCSVERLKAILAGPKEKGEGHVA